MGGGNSRAEWSRWLVREWSARLAEILESMAGSRPRVEWKPVLTVSNPGAEAATLAAQHGEVLWWEQTFNAASGARFWVGAPQTAWSALGRRVLSAAGIDDAEAAEARGTFLELVGQSLESLANAMGAHLGREVVSLERCERPEAPAGGECFQVGLSLEGEPPAVLLAVPADELADALIRPEPAAAPAAAPAPPDPAPQERAAAPADTRMLDLLLDVELPVSISFGRTYLPLKETLKLTTGSIVELNRAVTEPVDIIVNNCVIARGEVVVIEGNYGVRIREIMSREARLRNLR